ncbi:MAG: hypothetical protein KAT34_18765 [Candidatus Aminicenantes bacterium]|nr:hypothetical protein [Candidatus Aminicenantes bacterium]
MKKKTLTLVLISVFLFLISNETVVESKPDNYWPTEKWRNATPESQGMDSEILNNMLNFITMSRKAIRSVIVVRNGYMITEAYFYPFKKKMWHIMHSCSKSIMSSLIGIALEKKLISNINTPVINYFNGLNISNLDERKKT